MRNILLLFLVIFSQILSSQNVLPIGAWRTHHPKKVGKFVTQSKESIFYSASGAIMILDKDDLSPRFITRVDGLTGVDIRILRYHEASETLIIVYNDGVIDLYKNNKIVTINAIKNFTNISGEKTVNDIFLYDERTLILAGTYGVSTFLIDNGALPTTTFMGEMNVNAVAVFENDIYAGTDEGVYRSSLNNSNLDDFSTWIFIDSSLGLPDDYTTKAISVYGDALYIGVNEDVYRFSDGSFTLFSDQDNTLDMRYMSAEGTALLVGYRCKDSASCGRGKILYFNADGTEEDLSSACLGETNGVVEDQFGRFWFGDNWTSFRYLENKDAQFCKKLEYNGPYSSKVWGLSIFEDQLWLATGAMTATRTPLQVDAGMASMIDGQWTIYNRWTKDAFKGNDGINQTDDDVFTLIEVKGNPVTRKIYGASYFTGLIEIDGEEIQLFDKTNSPLTGTVNDESRTRVSGLAVDDEGNLWVSNYSPEGGKALHRLAPDGTWVSFDKAKTGDEDDFFQIVIDQNGYKWVIIGSTSAGVLLFDEGDINNLNDDRSRVFTVANSQLPSNETNCLVVDNKGNVWVGTNAGIIIFECGGAAFEDICQGSLRKIELDGFIEFLFKTQAVQAIAVDGANRKWVGTTNGVYLISDDGTEALLHYTTDNSPLLDNFIRSIVINEKTGEVFIGTDKGLISYQGDAVKGGRVNSTNPKVFPNPVRPDYEGPIAVKGLIENANVKITDANGKLVYETEAFGGQMIWDGRDYNGRRVQTGVYLVFSTTNPRSNGFAEPNTVVAKILFVN